jgi:hypothetical protein
MPCDWCFGTGWVLVIPFDDPMSEGSFACSKCRAPSVLGIQAGSGNKECRYWNDDLANKFFVVRFTQESLLEKMRLQRESRPELYEKKRGSAIDLATESLIPIEPTIDIGDEQEGHFQ